MKSGDRVVAMAILCSRTTWYGGVIPSRGLHVNCTGDPALDELTIEYNGLLTDVDFEGDAFDKCLAYLLTLDDWDELHLDGWGPHASSASNSHPRHGRLLRRKSVRCYCVGLSELRESGSVYLDRLPPKPRSKVNRSKRQIARTGAVSFSVASTIEEASAFLADLKRLHQRSWVGRKMSGAFANRFFDTFHKAFVAAEFPAGHIQLLRLVVNDRVAAVIYNFVYQGHVYSYQSGLDLKLGAGANWRPGIVSHAHAIEYNLKAGNSIYDFMAGDHAYKRELGLESSEMVWLVYRRSRLRFVLDFFLRRLRDLLRTKWRASP
jgi:hypothetical protein